MSQTQFEIEELRRKAGGQPSGLPALNQTPSSVRPRRVFDEALPDGSPAPDAGESKPTSTLAPPPPVDPSTINGAAPRQPPPGTTTISGMTDDGTDLTVAPDLTVTKGATEAIAPPAAMTRPRRAHGTGTLEANQDELTTLQQNRAHDQNGRWKSMLLNALSGMSEQARRVSSTGSPVDAYGIASILGAGGGSAVSGAVAPWQDEQRKSEQRQSELEHTIGLQLAIEKAQDLHREHEARTSNLLAKPEQDAAKERAKRLTERRGAALRILGYLRGQKIDPANPQHAMLLNELKDTGIVGVDPDSFNDAKGNIIHMTATDETDPTKTNNVEFNLVTGEQRVVAPHGFQQPVNAASGMTAAQERTDADRDAARTQSDEHFNRAFGATLHQRAVQNDLAQLRIGQGGERLDLARAAQDSRLDERTRTELKSAHRLQGEIAKARADADSFSRLGTFPGDDGKPHRAKWAIVKETEARNRADALQKEFDGTYGYLTQGTTAAPGAASPVLPRRGAPARRAAAPSSAGAQFGEAEVRARARAKGKSEDAAVEAARRAGLLRP